MAVYLGYYRAAPEALQENRARAREQGAAPDPRLQRLVVELLDKLPAGCTVLGSYTPMAGAVFGESAPPSVMIVDAEHPAALSFISQYYAGFLLFHWVPATRVGATHQEREAWAAAQAQVRQSWANAALLDQE